MGDLTAEAVGDHNGNKLDLHLQRFLLDHHFPAIEKPGTPLIFWPILRNKIVIAVANFYRNLHAVAGTRMT